MDKAMHSEDEWEVIKDTDGLPIGFVKPVTSTPALLKENQSLRSELQKQKELNAELVDVLEMFFEKDRIPAVHGAMPVALRSFRERAESLIKKSKES